MQLAAILFSLTAAGGLLVASFPLRGIPRPPLWLALGHGAAALASFAALAYGYTQAATSLATLDIAAIAVLVLAALGGATLFLGFHMRGQPLPKLLVLGHGSLGILGTILLWLSVGAA